jgi:DNA-directed RNA polymerase sigma subunit (sigma70/sigma32)
VSLDKTVGDDGDATLGDLMANGDGTPEDHVMTMVDSDLLDELLGTLDGRARYAVEPASGSSTASARASARSARASASPPRPPAGS